MSKYEVRAQLEAGVNEFLAQGGEITFCPDAPNGQSFSKAKNSRKQFKTSVEPSIRPRQNWDSIHVPHESRLYKGYAK
jgi:hypothetical protein